MIQEKRFQVQVLKPCKSIQESSNEVLDFKARQLTRQLSIYRGLKAAKARGSTASLIDDYLSRFMKLDFSELIFIQSVNMCLDFLFSQP